MKITAYNIILALWLVFFGYALWEIYHIDEHCGYECGYAAGVKTRHFLMGNSDE